MLLLLCVCVCVFVFYAYYCTHDPSQGSAGLAWGACCRRAQPSASAWRAAPRTPRKQIRAHVTWSNGTPLQYSFLENPTDRGAWWAAVHGVAKSRTRLSDFTFTFHFHTLEKEMATHSSVLVWRIPGIGEPGGLPSMGSHRVRHNWSNLAAATVHELMLRWLLWY